MLYQERDSADRLAYTGVTASSELITESKGGNQHVSSRVASAGMLSCRGAGI